MHLESNFQYRSLDAVNACTGESRAVEDLQDSLHDEGLRVTAPAVQAAIKLAKLFKQQLPAEMRRTSHIWGTV